MQGINVKIWSDRLTVFRQFGFESISLYCNQSTAVSLSENPEGRQAYALFDCEILLILYIHVSVCISP